jgi:predicted ATPase/class 3 adenylate cyclase
MKRLPSGTVTFLFTDIEGSTQLWEQHPDQMRSALAQHDSTLRHAIETHHGNVIKTTGDGFHAVFETAIDAIGAALAAQRELQSPAATGLELKVRMGLHTGEAELRDGDYYGQSLNRSARIMAAGHGGQILMSAVTAELAREHLSTEVSMRDLGEHRLKDLIRHERIFQLSTPPLLSEFPALNSLSTLPNNLPLQLTSFIGRERELRETNDLLASTRLLTLIGPGGTGKTRLSLQLAAEQFSHFKDGVWLAELAPLADPAFILSTIASIFELREVPGIPLTEILLDYLRAKKLLLIIDNCEHLVESSAQITDQILRACPHVRMIASSREALGINGETVYRVPSLQTLESERLFVERATKADSRFALTELNASFVAQICARLDGIPLAIELAAARINIFTPEQIAGRLNDRFKLLTGGSRTALPRQQTLRALIDWSYQSLNETEQRALRRLAVFSGGSTIEGAEAVIGEDEALDGLLGLVNKSLVNVEEQDGKSRYVFLETIRQYAMDKLLESGEPVEVRDRHFEFILQIALKSDRRKYGSESIEWLDQMELEHDNLRSAFEWSLAQHPEQALVLADAAAGFWTSRDYNDEAFTLCAAALEQSHSMPGLDQERAKVYMLMGWTCISTGRHKEGYAACISGLELARRTNDLSLVASTLSLIALTCTFLGEFEIAHKSLQEAERMARQNNLRGELAMLLTIYAQTTYFVSGDQERARAYLEEAKMLARDVGYRWVDSMSAFGLGRIAANLGDRELARQKLMESAEHARRFGNKRLVYSCYSELAHILRESGEIEEPLRTYRDLLPKWKNLGHRAAVAHELECIAYILIRKEEPERATILLGAAEALREIIDTRMTMMEAVEYEREVAILRVMLDENEFRTQWGAGRKLTMDEAIQLASNP